MGNEHEARQYFDLGQSLKMQGRLSEALAAFESAVRLRPDYVEAHVQLANGMYAMGRFDLALAAFRRVLTLRPDWVQVHFNIGNAYRNMGDMVQAMISYREAVRLNPADGDAWFNLGNACRLNHQLDESLAACRRAVELMPKHAGTYNSLGNTLKHLGRVEEAIAAFEKGLQLKPDDVVIHSNLLFALYNRETSGQRLLEQSREWDRRQAARLRPGAAHANAPDPGRKLRVGYVSADFRQHSVAFFLAPLLEAHDRSQVEVTCYWNDACGDAMTQRIQKAAARWRMIARMSDDQVAAQIRQDQIDILVDLSGHTGGHRLLVFARKPAPVQVTWLGFPGTTGISAMDYRISDGLADPPGASDVCCSEKLVRLPQTAWCFSPISGSPLIAPLPALKNGFVTFGSFNSFAKVGPVVLELWAKILSRVPNSRLLIKNAAMGSSKAAARVREFFGVHGLSADRLTLMTRLPDVADHQCQYHAVDVGLDTWPYHGTTTTCEALWMGVPVVTLTGEVHCSRVGVSLLTNAGSEELRSLIAPSPEQYVEAAVSLAGDLSRLAALREKLRPQMQGSPLMDAKRFATDMEGAYREMWKQWCAKRG